MGEWNRTSNPLITQVMLALLVKINSCPNNARDKIKAPHHNVQNPHAPLNEYVNKLTSERQTDTQTQGQTDTQTHRQTDTGTDQFH